MLRSVFALCALLVVSDTVVGSPPAAHARVLGVKLTGQELLVELDKIAPGPNPPGIYVLQPDDTFKLVLPYGRNPRWSPSRKRIACTEGITASIIDVASGSLSKGGYGCDIRSAQNLFSSLQANGTEWLPGEEGVVGWTESFGDSYYAPGPPPPTAKNGHPFLIPMVGWIKKGGKIPDPLIWWPTASVGRISFSPDGKEVAYESFDAVKDAGAWNRKVFILNRETGEKREVRPEGTEGGMLLNPLWEPKGNQLALDCLKPDRTRFTLLFDTASGRTRRLPPRPEFMQDWSQGLAWSPMGGQLLVARAANRGEEMPWVDLLDTRPEEPVRMPEVGRPGYVFRACWSPNGDQIAMAVGQTAYLEKGRVVRIHRYNLKEKAGVFREVDVPEYLQFVSMDW